MTTLQELTMIQALNQGLSQHLDRDPHSLILGEDIGSFGGVFRVTEGLLKKFGPERVIDTPLAECGIVGTGIGMALSGLHPIVEIQFADFVYPGINQIINELAKYRYRSGGQYCPKMLIRMPYGGGIGGGHYHSQSPEVFFTHTPGLRVIIPSGPYEAKGLLLGALNNPDPVIFLEPKRIYRTLKTDVPTDYYTLPIESAQILRPGEDLTVVAYGAMVHEALEAATVAETAGYDIEVIDLQSLLPYDSATLLASVLKTGRMIVVQEAPRTCGFAAELIAEIQEKAFHALEAPLERVTGFDTPFPYSLEDHYLPDAKKIYHKIKQVMAY